MGLQFFPEPAQVENRVDAPEQVIGGNTVVEIKCIEKSILPIDRWSHHRHFSNPNTQIRESHLDSYLNHLFQHPQPLSDSRPQASLKAGSERKLSRSSQSS